MPEYAEPTDRDSVTSEDNDEPTAAAARAGSATTGRTPRYTAGEHAAGRSVSPSASAKRAQPQRKPRSQRGKK